MAVQDHNLEKWFNERLIAGVPRADLERAEAILSSCHATAAAIHQNTDPGPEQTRSITTIREALDTAIRTFRCR